MSFITRLELELTELSDKHTKLVSFINGNIFNGLDEENRELLIKQEFLMREYIDVLKARLKLLKDV